MKTKNWKTSAYLFIAAQLFSLFGSSVVTYSIAWYISLETGSGFWLMLSMVAANLPLALFSPISGALVDRYNRKKMIMLADGGIAVLTLFIAILFQIGYDNIILLILISVFRSIGQSVQQSAGNALVQQIVPQEELTGINGAFQGIQALLTILGPVIGGIVFANFGLEATFYLDIITAGIEILLLSLIVVPNLPRVSLEKSSLFKDFKDSLTYVKSSGLLKKMFATSLVIYALLTPVAYLAPLFIQRTFGSNLHLLSIGELAWGVGSLAGGILLMKFNKMTNKIRMLMLSMIAFAVLSAFVGFSPVFSMYVVFIALAGLFLPVMVTILTVILQENVKPEYMGRTFSLVMGTSSVMSPLAMMAVGPLSDQFDIKWIYLTASILLIGYALLLGRMEKKESQSAERIVNLS